MKNLAVIPARSGSKGLKDKNIKLLNGKPLMWYSIKVALQSGFFDTVMVSTDSAKYADVAISCGADVPFLRSKELSGDNASSWAVVKEVLDDYASRDIVFDSVMLLQPTSPLRIVEDIKNAYSILSSKNANGVISVTEMDHSPLWSNTLPEDLDLDSFIKKENNVPRQLLPKYYRYNGAIYLIKNTLFKDLLQSESWTKLFGYIMPKNRSVDIDDELDFVVAEEIMKITKNG